MNRSRPIQICVVEDHEDIRQGMVHIINTQSGFHCTSCKNGEEALMKFKESSPDVVLMDINLPGMNGIECTRLLKERYPDILIIMCTVFADNDKIFDALKAGARGYILKRNAGDTLIDAINELLNGGAPMSGEIAFKVVSSFEETRKQDLEYPSLTNQENKILELLAMGYGNKEIADRLFISVNTVRTHICHIYEKLHVHNRIEALNKIKKTTFKG